MHASGFAALAENNPAADSKPATCEKAHIPADGRPLCCAALKFWSPGTPKGAGGLGTRPQRGGAVAFLLSETARQEPTHELRDRPSLDHHRADLQGCKKYPAVHALNDSAES